MKPVPFPGSVEVPRPENMTEGQCTSIWAIKGKDILGFPYFETAWIPSAEELAALNDGFAIKIRTISMGLPPMSLYVQDLAPEPNDNIEN